jgi:hypothetical protein
VSDTIFQNKVEMKNFTYEGREGLDEEAVKQAVSSFLQGQGYTVAVGKKRERGPDLRATTKEGLKLVVEAKGEGSLNAMFNNFFLNALGEILQRMNELAAEYGIAMPAHRKFGRLIEELSDSVRYTLRLNFYLVRPASAGVFEVGLLTWKVR